MVNCILVPAGLRFSTQDSHGGSQLSLTPVLEDPTPSSGVQTSCGAHIHDIKINLTKNKGTSKTTSQCSQEERSHGHMERTPLVLSKHRGLL